jgi:hypothetical protein
MEVAFLGAKGLTSLCDAQLRILLQPLLSLDEHRSEKT